MPVIPIGPPTGGIMTANVYAYVTYSGVDFPVLGPIATNQMVNEHVSDGGPQALPLASGSNTIPVPIGAGGFLLELPFGNAVAVTIKLGQAGDTGTRMAPAGWMAYPFDQAAVPANIYITAGAIINGAKILWF